MGKPKSQYCLYVNYIGTVYIRGKIILAQITPYESELSPVGRSIASKRCVLQIFGST